ncbi:unnamed protein product [Rotaria socialis]|uniref:Guanosine-3',5'-bis(diphosphate) 3'-pyrophosphohydrolase MESH1 n=1 Tax=Rotaria socialis TaxID=392032 RepID=A0A818MVZ7_9BILA|nr:unnamed protein product [Rotaria socialis]CAF3595692.1 unnamed protein product [Rotaria socialis]CAF4250029.1 unnamed protein product [Rotaria socialis]
MEKFMQALQFAAHKHRFQKRKDPDQTPYINHPIGVAHILSNEAGVTDSDILAAALLHDTIEDTQTTFDELQQEFGPRIAGIVAELTDDKNLPKAERKRLQIANADKLTLDAVIVRLADKIYNLRDLNRCTPVGWSDERVKEYFEWSSKIAPQLFGRNAQLDAVLKELFLQKNIRFD